MTDNGQINALERLAKLRDSGDLTPEEYQREKAKLLSGPSGVPLYRRLWFVVTLTCLIVTFPVSLLILVTGDVYKKSKSEGLQPISTRARYVYAGALVLWILALVIRAALNPQSAEQAWNSNAVDEHQASVNKAVAEAPNLPIACDSTEAADEVKDALENGATSALVQIKVEDFGHAQELYFAKRSNARVCQADAVLNTGATTISYEIFFGPSGKQMVQVRQGIDAFHVDIIKALEATAAGMEAAKTKQAQTASTQSSADAQSQNSNVQNTETSQAIGPGNTDIPDHSQESPALQACLTKAGGDDGSRADEADCYEQELGVQDKQLNVTYSTVIASMSADEQVALRASQREWIKERDRECNGNTGVDTGNAGETATPACLIDMTVRRRMQLEQMQVGHSN